MVNNNKIRALEDHVLPEHPEKVYMTIKNDPEIALYKKANAIRERIYPQLNKAWENHNLTILEKDKIVRDVYNSLDPVEKMLLTKDAQFFKTRLFDLIVEHFKPLFPKTSLTDLMMRVTWFFENIEYLAIKERMIDSAWNHNRDESNPDFDDIKWWQNMDAQIKKEFPDGIFTKKSFNKLRDWYDKKESELIGQYWKDHPEEYKGFMEGIEKRMEKLKP